MKHLRASRCAALAIAGCLAHASAQAATIGRAQGAVLIGRPLEIIVPLVLEGPGDAAPACAQAEVFYGDAKVPGSSVNTELQTGARGTGVRVSSGAAVNEPVVTVYLQLGCGSRFTRRLVLLSEPDPAVDAMRSSPGATPGTAARDDAAQAAVNAAPLNLSMSRGLPTMAPPAAAPHGSARRKRAPAAPVASKPATTARAKAAPGGILQPRAAASAPATPKVPAVPQPAPQARAQLKLDVPLGVGDPSVPSEEQLRQAARLQSIERDLGEMRQFLKRNDAAMLQLQAQLARAESERYANPLVYALAALLLVMAGVMAYLWRRGATARDAAADDWWHSPRPAREAPVAAAAAAGSRAQNPPDRPAKTPAPSASDGGDPAPAAGATAEQPLAPTVRIPLTSVTARTDDFQGSQAGSRALKAEELHDVQQEADFFSSLGEYDRAIEVLRAHIQAHPETSAVAWLDLVEIYHKLGRRDEFDWVRREFRQRFNAQVPAFDEYSQESAGIEAYDNAMARIAALWPSRRVLDVIEESIFRGPSKDGAEAFSLQAYRELLLLHHIGQQVLAGTEDDRASAFSDSGAVSGANSGSHGFSHTSIHPLSTGLASLDQPPPREAERSDDDGHEVLALDLNLDEPRGEPHGQPDVHLLDFDLPDSADAGQASKQSPLRPN